MQNKSSSKRLELSNFKLKTLLSITKSINSNSSTSELLGNFKNILQQDLNIGKILLFSYNKKWNCILASGISNDFLKKINVKDNLSTYKSITNVAINFETPLNNFDFVIPVFHHDEPIAYVLIGDIDEEQDGMSPAIKHLNFIQTLTNIIVVAIENKRLFKESIKQEALKRELELAAKMQSMLVPDPNALPNNENLKLSVYYLPHSEVSGDYYDFFDLSKNECGFCIADVSGKGISAALLMSNFQANIRALFSTNHSLSDIVSKLNKLVTESVKGEKFITLFVAKYNIKTHILTYINAGHNPPILLDTKNNKISQLNLGCVGIGMLDNIPSIEQGEIIMNKGNRLVCYTDGVDELENEKGETFDMKIIHKLMADKINLQDIVKKIVENLYIHKGENSFFDDVSIMGVEF